MYTERLAETTRGMPRMFRLFGANMFAGLGTSMFVKKYLMHSSTRNTTGTAQYKWQTQKVWNFFYFFKIINNDVWYISIRQWARNPCPKVRQGPSRMSENESQLTKNKLLSGARWISTFPCKSATRKYII